MFLKLSAVDNRAPIYSKERIPTMPPHEILVEQKRAGSADYRPTLNFGQRVTSHRNIQMQNQKMFERLVNAPSDYSLDKMRKREEDQ
jgi:hypothetical protein